MKKPLPPVRVAQNVGTYTTVVPIAVKGIWAVTPTQATLPTTTFAVTHTPSGYSVADFLSSLKAVAVCKAFAALPNQRAWKSLKDPKGLTPTMRARGKKIRQRFGLS